MKKKVERELELVNIFGVKNDFKINYYFNDILGNSDLVTLEEFTLNGTNYNPQNLIQQGENKDSQSSYKYFWGFNLENIEGQEVKIKYKMTSKLPLNDKTCAFISNYMIKDLNHTIVLNKEENFGDVDVALFSLVEAMTKNKDNFGYKVRSYNDTTIMCNICGKEWLFPSDGYILSFR